jgi:Circularly permutated YpsA SLOG family
MTNRPQGTRIKIVSGGQTGVDRAALDFALRHGFEHGGWCPRGRLAEDDIIPPIYRLRETDSAEYEERTEKNVLDSDTTLIVARERELSGGTAFTKTCAEQHGRPLLVVWERDGLSHGAAALSKFLKQNKVRTLNVAGPRESQAPGLRKFVRELLEAALFAKLTP